MMWFLLGCLVMCWGCIPLMVSTSGWVNLDLLWWLALWNSVQLIVHICNEICTLLQLSEVVTAITVRHQFLWSQSRALKTIKDQSMNVYYMCILFNTTSQPFHSPKISFFNTFHLVFRPSNHLDTTIIQHNIINLPMHTSDIYSSNLEYKYRVQIADNHL